MGNNYGVYAIKNKTTQKLYVGSSSDLKYRKTQHFSDLRCKRHFNLYLQNAFNKYGENDFEWLLLEETNLLLIKEKEWIDKLESTNHKKGYNLAEYPVAPMMGRKHSAETIKKFRNGSRLGAKHPNAKTNEKVVKKIFDLHSKGMKQKEISVMTGVGHASVQSILKGTSWSYLGLASKSKIALNNTSGCTGVYYVKNQHKWKAEIIKNGIYSGLGYYKNKKDAIKARKDAEVSLGV